jgi:phosphate transport system permease protein
VRYFVDVMTGVPSIIFGLFIYITLVISHVGGNFTGWKGSIALSAADAADRHPLDRGGAACSCRAACARPPWHSARPRWRWSSRVVLPTALPGWSPARCWPSPARMGETAPLLFTVAVANALTFNLASR